MKRSKEGRCGRRKSNKRTTDTSGGNELSRINALGIQFQSFTPQPCRVVFFLFIQIQKKKLWGDVSPAALEYYKSNFLLQHYATLKVGDFVGGLTTRCISLLCGTEVHKELQLLHRRTMWGGGDHQLRVSRWGMLLQ